MRNGVFIQIMFQKLLVEKRKERNTQSADKPDISIDSCFSN